MESSQIKIPLLAYRFKFIGILLVLFSLIFGYLYFLGGRPSCFEVPVFAVATTYVESRFFVFAQTNILDELAAILLILGFLFISLSKERNESSAHTNIIRIRSLFLSVYITFGLWILIFLLIYGWSIFLVSSSMMLVFLVVYFLTFRILLRKNKKQVKGLDLN